MNSIRHFLTPANAITSAGLAAGFLALLATIDAQILQATIWVILAAVCVPVFSPPTEVS